MRKSIVRRSLIAGLIGVALASGGIVTAGAAAATATGTAATRTVLSTSPSAPLAGQNVNLRAVVKPVTAGSVPTGVVDSGGLGPWRRPTIPNDSPVIGLSRQTAAGNTASLQVGSCARACVAADLGVGAGGPSSQAKPGPFL